MHKLLKKISKFFTVKMTQPPEWGTKNGYSLNISDASWGTFVRLLEYKANWNDKQIIKINRWYPSSKTCCECGWINQDLNLSIREWTCKNGHVLDRDLNAAKNTVN